MYLTAQGDVEGDHHPASVLREEDTEEAEGYFEHLLRGQGEAMTAGEDYFDRIVGEIEDLIIDERFLQLQSGGRQCFTITNLRRHLEKSISSAFLVFV